MTAAALTELDGFMNTLQGIAAHASRRWRTLGWLSGALFSCLPTQDLSSYSSGGLPVDPDVSISEQSPELPADVLAQPGEGATVGADPSSECGTECSAPVLPVDDNAGSTDVAVADRDAQLKPADAGADAAPEPPAADAGADAGAACPGGAQPGPGGRCLVLVGVARSWADARSNCRARGAGWDLATIRDAEQNASLVSLFGSADAGGAAITDAWLGATDATTEGTWLWVGDTTAFWIGTGTTGDSVGGAYENWGGNAEPNGGEASDCLRLRSAGGWGDIACSTQYASICAGPAL